MNQGSLNDSDFFWLGGIKFDANINKASYLFEGFFVSCNVHCLGWCQRVTPLCFVVKEIQRVLFVFRGG